VNRVVVAAVQAAPVLCDTEATIERCVALLAEAAEAGAQLVVFPESFVPGYPDWVWRTRPWSEDAAALHARLLDQAVVVGSPALDPVRDAARRAGAHVVLGVTERERHGATLFNTLVHVDGRGDIVLRHRKLVATGAERLVWGGGDGSTLRVVDTPFGRVAGLICWELYMPLARCALYAQGVDVLVAPTWDTSDVWVPTLRHVAKEGRVHVVGVAQAINGGDLPADLPARHLWGGADDWLSRGLSTVVDPSGTVLAGPLEETCGLVLATIDPGAGRAARAQFDPVGHYARPDVFRLHVDTTPRPAVTWSGGPTPGGEPMDIVELHRRACELFARLVHEVGDDQWSAATPCDGWDVRALVNHVVAEDRWTVPLLDGAKVAEVGDRFDGDVLGADPVGACEAATKEATAAAACTDPDRTVHLSFGDVGAREYLGQLFAEHLVHAWDLARGIGADEALPADLVAACAAWFAEREEAYRAAGHIGPRPPLPEAADPQQRLLAAFGRQPGGQAA
jgi:nitrilase